MHDIKHIMERFGRKARLCQPDGLESESFGAFLQPLRYKNKMYLGGVNTRIGFNREGYYLYLGPPEHDLGQLGQEAWIQCGSEKYTVDRTELVYFGQQPSHVWAIVRSMVE
jgi:hypothetical protein